METYDDENISPVDKYLADLAEALPPQEDQAQSIERNSNRLRIIEWSAAGLALFTAGLAVKHHTLRHAH